MKKPNDFAAGLPLAPLAAWLALAWPAPATSAQVLIKPSIDLRGTYSDNMTLAPTGSEQSGFITEIAPHLGIGVKGRWLSLSADYTMHYFDYTRIERGSKLQQELRAVANGELLEDLLFIDSDASSTRQSISAFAPHANDRGDLAGNQADVRTYRVSPYLRHRFGGTATAVLRYTHDALKVDRGGLSDSTADHIGLGLAGGSDFVNLQWKLSVNYQKTDYAMNHDEETRVVTGEMRYLITPRFSVGGSAGYENNTYLSIGNKPEGAFWTIGIGWKPTGRTSLSASVGHRYFGNTIALLARQRTRFSTWSASYQEEITTARSQFLMPTIQSTVDFLAAQWKDSIPDEAQRAAAVDRFMRDEELPGAIVVPVNSFTNRVFLQKSANLSGTLTGVRHALVVHVFRVEREPQSVAAADLGISAAAAGLNGEASRQDGISTSWNWTMSARTSMTAGAGRTRIRSLLTGRQDDELTLRAGVVHQFQPALRGGVELRRLDRRSNAAAGDLRENAVVAFLQISI